MKKPKHHFIAIKRELLYPENNNRRYLGGLPALVGNNDDAPLYVPPGAPGCPSPIEYFLIPVCSKGSWDGVEGLHDFEREVQEKARTNLVYGSANPTLLMPQLRHSFDSDYISVTQLSHRNYQIYKQFAGDQITEVESFDELIKQFNYHLPDEPPEIDVNAEVKNMLSKVPPGPLNGVLVVAFDQQIAGSLASEELARKGATVIKIETAEGDPKRKSSGKNAFATFNAGKFSITFSHDEAGERLKQQLLSLADVVVDNRSTKAQERDKQLQDALHDPVRLKPLIFCGISGFGRDSNRTAYDRVIQAESGMADFNGKLIPFPIIDMATAKEAASEVMAHLFMRSQMTPRERVHSPCIRLDVSMISVALNMMANQVATLIDTGSPENILVPFNVYMAKDGKKISVAVAKDEQFAKLCNVIGADDLKQYKTNRERHQHKDIVEDRLAEILATRNSEEWIKLLSEQELPVGPVLSLQDALKKHGHQVVKAAEDDSIFIGSPTASSVYPRNPHIGGAPSLNQHNSAIKSLAEHLEQNKDNPKAHAHSVAVSAVTMDRKFQNEYEFVDPHEVDFSKDKAAVDWVKPTFFMVKKTGAVTAEPAKLHEVVNTKHTDATSGTMLIGKRVAMEGDWKITTSFGDQYVLSEEAFKRNYVPVEGKEGEYAPNPELSPKKAVKIAKNVCFMSSENEVSYIPAGGWLVQGNSGIYGIHPNNVASNYEVTKHIPKSEPEWAKLEQERKWASLKREPQSR